MRHEVRNALPLARSPSNSDGVEGLRESFFRPAEVVSLRQLAGRRGEGGGSSVGGVLPICYDI